MYGFRIFINYYYYIRCIAAYILCNWDHGKWCTSFTEDVKTNLLWDMIKDASIYYYYYHYFLEIFLSIPQWTVIYKYSVEVYIGKKIFDLKNSRDLSELFELCKNRLKELTCSKAVRTRRSSNYMWCWM